MRLNDPPSGPACGLRPLAHRAAAGMMLGFFLAHAASATNSDSSWAVTGGTLIDGSGASPAAGAVILGRGERITCVGNATSCPIPAGAIVVDAMGKWVIPGLIDTHIHLNWAERANDARQAQVKRLAFGVTTTRDAGTPHTLEENLAARERSNWPTTPEPRLLVSALVSHEGLERFGGGDAAGLVGKLTALGPDAIKIKEQYAIDQLPVVVSEAHAAGLPVFGHTWDHGGSHLDTALAAGIDGLSHMYTIAAFSQRADGARPPPPGGAEYWVWSAELWNYLDDARVERAIDAIVEHRVWLEPMLVTEQHRTFPYPLPNDLAYLEEIRPLSEVVRAALPFGNLGWRASRERRERVRVVYQHTCETVRRLHARGAMLVTGTDGDEPGPALPDEVRLLGECGLSPMAALLAATRDAAVAVKRQEDIGTIEAGKLADFVILTADPLRDPANLRRIWRVVKGGHLYDPATLLGSFISAHRRLLRTTWAFRAFGAGGSLLTLGAILFGVRLWRRRN
jgi:imidazolonepropionase-like amidohydrolase